VDVAVALRQALRERLPLVPASSAAVHTQFCVVNVVLTVALDGNDVDGLRLVCMHIDREPEVRWQVPAHLFPRVTGIIAAHHVPMLLHKQHSRSRGMHCNVMNTVANLRSGIWNVLREESAVDRLPGLAAVIASKRARGRDCDVYPLRIAGVENDRMQAHPAGARLPLRPGAVSAESR